MASHNPLIKLWNELRVITLSKHPLSLFLSFQKLLWIKCLLEVTALSLLSVYEMYLFYCKLLYKSSENQFANKASSLSANEHTTSEDISIR